MLNRKKILIAIGCTVVAVAGIIVVYFLAFKKTDKPEQDTTVEEEIVEEIPVETKSVGELLLQTENKWKQSDTGEGNDGLWYYSVTDLDGDTLPEVIATRIIDDKYTSELHIYAVTNSQYDTVQECSLSGFEEGDVPDMTITETECYFNSDNDNRYIFDDVSLSDDEKTITDHRYAIRLKDNTLIGLHTSTVQATYSADTESWSTKYYSPDGTEIDMDEYYRMENKALPEYYGGNRQLEWISQTDLEDTEKDTSELLEHSYSVFVNSFSTDADNSTDAEEDETEAEDVTETEETTSEATEES